jgi:hypothetical protein
MNFVAKTTDFQKAVLKLVRENCFPFEPYKTKTFEPLILIYTQHLDGFNKVSFHVVGFDQDTSNHLVYFEDEFEFRLFRKMIAEKGGNRYPIVKLETLVWAAHFFVDQNEIKISFDADEIVLTSKIGEITNYKINTMQLDISQLDTWTVDHHTPSMHVQQIVTL